MTSFVKYLIIVLYLVLPFCVSGGNGWPTKGGNGGRVIWVTSLEESGEGTLRAALDIDEPRIIRFAIAGEIWINDVLRIKHPYVTIDGSSAPSPGISIFGDQVWVSTHNVIIRDIRIRTSARSLGSHPSNRYCLQIAGSNDGSRPVYNVLVENCSFAWAIDEAVSLWVKGSHDIVDSPNWDGRQMYMLDIRGIVNKQKLCYVSVESFNTWLPCNTRNLSV